MAASSLLIFCSLLLLCLSFPTFISCDSDSSVSFNFYDYLDGVWEVSKSTAHFASGDVRSHSLRGRYEFVKRNDTAVLALQGSYYDNDTDTNEVSNQLKVSVEFQDSATGTFSTGEDEEAMKELFRFSFIQPSGNGIPISVGEWSGGSLSYYQFQCISPLSFIITVSPKAFGQSTDDEDNHSVTIYTGRKIVPAPPKTFWQQYGTFVMIGVFFLFNTFVKSKTAAMQQTAANPAVAAGGKKEN
jgi:hypothetical protein